ncbi:MAG: IS66 family insertion sequence element accessory protein TnpB [Bdellovibrio sp.]|jgi:transposase
MKSPGDFKKVFIHKEPVDMRKAMNGLSAIVQQADMGDLMQPHLFVFSGRRRNVIKILYFDKSGFCLWQKRLEVERFSCLKKLAFG